MEYSGNDVAFGVDAGTGQSGSVVETRHAEEIKGAYGYKCRRQIGQIRGQRGGVVG